MDKITWSEELETRRKELNLYADPVFKLLIQFIEFVILLVERFGGVHVETVEYKNREPDPLMMDGKRNIMDAMVIINGDILVDIEMQAYKKETDIRRFSHYSDMLNILRTKRGNTYAAKVSIVLVLSKYRMRKDGKASHEPIVKRYDDGTIFYKEDMIIPVELVHLKHLWKKPVTELTPKERLSLWLEYSNDDRYKEQMNQIYEMDKELKKMEIIVKQACMEDELFFRLRDEADEYFKELEKEIQAKKLAEQKEKMKQIECRRKAEEQKRKAEEQKRKAEEQKRKLAEQKLHEERKTAVEQLLLEGFDKTKICKILSINSQEYDCIVKTQKKY